MNQLELLSCKQCGAAILKNCNNKALCISCDFHRVSLLRQVQAYTRKQSKSAVYQAWHEFSIAPSPEQPIYLGEENTVVQTEKNICKLCGVELEASNGRKICFHCISKYSNRKILDERLQKARRTEKKADFTKPNLMEKKFGFKSSYKEKLLKYVGSIEIEILPEVETFKNIRLSNKFKNPLSFA